MAILALAMDGTILRANDNFLRLFGYTAADIVGLHHAMLVSAEEVDGEADQALWVALRNGELHSAECRRIRKGGAAIWLQATYSPVLDDEGRATEILVIAADITAEKRRAAEDRGQIAAFGQTHCVAHFALDGTVLNANELFLGTMGYTAEEVSGHGHRLFADRSGHESAAHAAFWRDLGAGLSQAGEYLRFGKDGKEVWLKATYTPIADMEDRPFKIVVQATDVTRDRLRQADHEGQIAAICKSQGVITFDMGGTILDANDVFLAAMGYRLEEIEGRHHRIFVDPSYAHGSEYATFWDHLAAGRHQSAEYKRFGKEGREVWLHASYNPVCDLNGRPFKIVNYATDITREKLRQANYQGQIAAIHKAQCVISFDLDGIIIDANDNFLEATGYRLAEIRGRHHRMFVEPAMAASQDYADFWLDLARGRHRVADFKRLGKNGREIWLHATYNPIFDMNGRPFRVVKYATDVTLDRLRQADHEGQIAAIKKSQCVIEFDMAGHVLDANENFLTVSGYRLDEIKGRHHRLFVEPGFAAADQYAEFWATLRQGSFVSAKLKRIGKGGREIWIQASYNPIADLNGEPFKVVKIFTDISADVAREASLRIAEQRVLHDATTSLPNRLHLSNFMTEALADPEARLAVLYLDLDHFKPINDTYGHEVGDHVLCETADRLRRALEPGRIVARVGGDEFVVAAPNLSDQEIEALCRSLITIVTAPIHHDKRTFNVGLSIGVAVSPGDGHLPEELLRCADVALYRAKGNGRGSYSFHAHETDEHTAANRNLAEEMRHGIKAGQFFLECQPRINVRTKDIDSVEALVRWDHPERGRLEPSDFALIAEKSGLVVPLGEWMLRAACAAAVGWAGVGLVVRVSSVQFRSSDLLELIEAVLAETGLAAERLQLEVADEIITEDGAALLLEALKASGVQLVVEDTGAVDWSLEELRASQFDFVRIGPRFASVLQGHDGGREIAQAILGVSKLLDRPTEADGVNAAGHLLRLSLDGCTEIEGFVLADPMAPADLAAQLDPGPDRSDPPPRLV